MFETRIVDYTEYADRIRSIREDVFIREQGVPREIEVDGLDPEAIHSIALERNIEVGTGRMLRDGHIGRIAVRRHYRRKGVGRLIMHSLLNEARARQIPEVWLSSQYHAKDFYQKLGFIEMSDIYQEAGIAHIRMKKRL